LQHPAEGAGVSRVAGPGARLAVFIQTLEVADTAFPAQVSATLTNRPQYTASGKTVKAVRRCVSMTNGQQGAARDDRRKNGL